MTIKRTLFIPISLFFIISAKGQTNSIAGNTGYQSRYTECSTVFSDKYPGVSPLFASNKSISNGKWKIERTVSENENIKTSPSYGPLEHIRYGAKLTQHFNYPLMHTSPTSSIYYQNHNIYLGPEYTILLTKSSNDSTDWQPSHWGLNVGYRYIIKSERKKTNLFLQMNFSFYQVNYKEYQAGSNIGENKEKMIIENTGGVGVNYRFNKRLEIFGGVGIGSTCGFFLLFKHFIPHSFIGIGYTIN